MRQDRLAEALKGHGVDYADIRLEDQTSAWVIFRGQELDSIGSGRSVGGIVRALYKGGWGYATFNDLADLAARVQEAGEIARLVGKGATKFAPIEPVVDVDNWLRTYAVEHIVGNNDSYAYGGGQNMYAYKPVDDTWKLLIWEIKRSLMPRPAVMERPLWEGNRRIFVNDARVRQVGVFVFLYLMTYMLGTLILCASGYSLSDSLFEFASAVGTVGLSVGVTSADMPDVALWAETFAMFLGRLEFVIVFTSVIKLVGDGGVWMAATLNPKRG